MKASKKVLQKFWEFCYNAGSGRVYMGRTCDSACTDVYGLCHTEFIDHLGYKSIVSPAFIDTDTFNLGEAVLPVVVGVEQEKFPMKDVPMLISHIFDVESFFKKYCLDDTIYYAGSGLLLDSRLRPMMIMVKHLEVFDRSQLKKSMSVCLSNYLPMLDNPVYKYFRDRLIPNVAGKYSGEFVINAEIGNLDKYFSLPRYGLMDSNFTVDTTVKEWCTEFADTIVEWL